MAKSSLLRTSFLHQDQLIFKNLLGLLGERQLSFSLLGRNTKCSIHVVLNMEIVTVAYFKNRRITIYGVLSCLHVQSYLNSHTIPQGRHYH